MIQKKVCLLGAFAVGKTSLVQRFVKSLFSDRYLTTVGVKIDKKTVFVDGSEVTLILWDLAGEDEFQTVQLSYLRGAAGYLLVVDGTRKSTIDTAELIRQRVTDEVGELPFVMVVNKVDLKADWEVDDDTIDDLTARGAATVRASAKTGEGVEEAFSLLARKVTGGGS
jgi:small GTP-binding protein